MKLFGTWFFLCLFTGIINAQEFSIHIHWHKDTLSQKSGTNSFPWQFENAHIADSNLQIPQYKKTIPIQFSQINNSIRVKELISQPLDTGYSSLLSPLQQMENKLTPATLTTRDRSFMAFNFYPITEVDGQYHRIEKIVYEFDKKKPFSQPHLKSASVNSSVLQSGEWYKFKVAETGIYKLTYSDLLALGFTNLDNIKLYGNGGTMLSKYNADPRKEDLQEIPVYINRGGNGVFDQGDYMLMYLEGPTTWRYEEEPGFFQQALHGYSNHAHYFLTTSQGKAPSIPTVTLTDAPTEISLNTYDYRTYYEKEAHNLTQSGRRWFSHTFSISTSKDTTFTVPNLQTSAPVILKYELGGRAKDGCSFRTYVNNSLTTNIAIPSTDIGNKYGQFAKLRTVYDTVSVSSGSVHTRLQFQQTAPQDRGYIDYITLNATASLGLNSSSLLFRDASSISISGAVEYRLSNAGSNTHIWHVTDINNIERVHASLAGNTLSFKAPGGSLLEFAAVDYQGDFPKPIMDADRLHVGWIENQNYRGLQSADMIIVTPEIFKDYARELADFRQEHDNLSVFVAEVNKIYNEYSSGNRDIAAIRDFARDVYLKSNGALKYLLLFGDGSYNNLSNHPKNTNLIPTYQSAESIHVINSYVSDDFFGLMDAHEGETDGLLDLAVGRLPVKDTIEARNVLNKILDYYKTLKTDKWHLNLAYVGDDFDSPSSNHMSDADLRAKYMARNYPEYILNKIYLDAYKQQTSASGNRYPDVNKAIKDALLKGHLMINYSGHGGENGLAHERILTREDIKGWNNKGRYPIFVTATCELSRYDLVDENFQKDETTAGEEILLKKDGGGVALFTTTRVVYKSSNERLNRKLHENAFVRDENGERLTIGEIIRATKVDYFMSYAGGIVNTLNFSLLGDPSMKVAFTDHNVITDSINGVSVAAYNDTINALQKVRISGHIENIDGQTLNDYNGVLYSTIFDKPKEVQTLNNDGHGSFQFEMQKDIIFSGRSSIENGHFSFEFIVPKDIAFFTGPGKISYYATDSVTNGSGYLDSLMVGGIAKSLYDDNEGPTIDLYLNDSTFKNGGITNANPILYAVVEDENGINTSSYNVGHDILAFLDDDENNPVILNDYYEATLNSYKKGIITYPLSDLEPGPHTLRLKVWDTYNNPAEATIQFNVIGDNNFELRKIFNYPNPFKVNTRIEFEHNMPNQDLDVIISFYDLAGNKMGILRKKMYTSGFSSSPVYWDGTINGSPIAAGLYLYTVEVRNQQGTSAMGRGKLIKSR